MMDATRHTHQFVAFLAHLTARRRFESFADMQKFVMKMFDRGIFVWITASDMERSADTQVCQTSCVGAWECSLPICNCAICSTPHYSKRTDSVETISILDAMQFHAVVMPILEQPSLVEFFLGSPGNIFYDSGDQTGASV
jgi:hypothetical protein